jgi:hypothetical protein
MWPSARRHALKKKDSVERKLLALHWARIRKRVRLLVTHVPKNPARLTPRRKGVKPAGFSGNLIFA